MLNLTPAQYRAIYEHDKNLVVVAGAGSGKTRVLVERYLALLDSNPDWPLNALVAITFTRRAAQEMRDRVRLALEERLSRADSDDARQIWAGRLASMESALIDTIHGLCANLLRANAAEAELDPDFGVLDEVDARILLENVIEDVLEGVKGDDPAFILFEEYDAAALRRVLTDFAGSELDAPVENLLDFWRDGWRQDAVQAVERLRTNPGFLSARQWQPSTGWPQNDKLMDVWDACIGCLEQFDSYVAAGEIASSLDALRRLKAEIRLTVGSAASWGGKDILVEAKEALRQMRQTVGDILDEMGDPPGAPDEKAARFVPAWNRLMMRIRDAYSEAKAQQGMLDFDDLEQYTRRLLEGHSGVRERYQAAEFKHLLVDEFQDTNAAQWQIVRALADPALPGRLFVVGDQKQSIYAFRGADVAVFGGVRRIVTANWGQAAEIALARSFRTHQPLVNCFNSVFQRLLKRDENILTGDYEVEMGALMDAHRHDPPGDGPALELLVVDKSQAADKISTEEARRWEAFEIARRLRALVEAGTPVYDRADGVRPMRYDDMVILFQSMSNVALYEEVFKAQSLPFLTLEGRGYYQRQEVNDLLNLLRALYNPADDLSLASALRSPLFGLSDDALLALRLERDANDQRLSLWAALERSAAAADEQGVVDFAREVLYRLRRLAGRVTISELLREALDYTGYLATLTGLPDGARRRGNVEKLLEKAESSGKVTLGAFSQYLDDLSAREVREGEALLEVEGVVTLMTVHASKGLEFPLVVLADASWQRENPYKPPVMAHPQYGLACRVYDPIEEKYVSPYLYRRLDDLNQRRETAERKRLLYVAATRAQDYLLISGQVDRNKEEHWKVGGWMMWLLDALDITPDELTGGENLLIREWGALRAHLLVQPPPESEYIVGESGTHSVWESAEIRAGQPLGESLTQPPLLAAVKTDRTAPARHLSVTHLADLGSAAYAPYFAQRFRRSVLQDAPNQIEPVFRARSMGRLVGEIVHEALRWWRFPNENEDFAALLDSYAWEQGIVDSAGRAEAVRRAQSLLRRFQSSDVYSWVNDAQQVFRELPFVYKRGERIIHGIIDLLIQGSDGRWRVIDYKTSAVEGGQDDLQRIKEHARRYHLQVGAYAEAVAEQLRRTQKVDALDVEVYIHYIRYGQTVRVQRKEWRRELTRLEELIDNLIG